jgi:hypothetical protein
MPAERQIETRCFDSDFLRAVEELIVIGTGKAIIDVALRSQRGDTMNFLLELFQTVLFHSFPERTFYGSD